MREEFFKASTRIIDVAQFNRVLSHDIAKARAVVVILSPFLKLDRVNLFLSIRSIREALGLEIPLSIREGRAREPGTGFKP
ncbi:MAG: hypothetical protein OWQ48_00125 [Desulfurococcus sp.]|nr:hypothetical protein [Desulfurococcus sp.]